MEEIKTVIKRSLITSAVILLYGIIIKEKIIYLGMFGGSVISVIAFYMLCVDVKSIVASNGAYKAGIISYLKRYVLYGLAIGVSAHFFGAGMLLSTAIGLLNVKFNILIMVLYNKLKKFKKKYLK